MMSRQLLSVLALLAFGLVGFAEDKKEDKKQPIKGIWQRDAEGIELTFEFKTAEELILKAAANGASVTVTSKYSVDKDGKVSAEVTKVKDEGEFPMKPEVGYKFAFKFKADKETAKLSDFEAENADQVKAIIEGEYKAKKAD